MISSVGKTIGRGLKLAELLFFPSHCKLCSSPLESPQERVVCKSCIESLQHRRSSFCLSCGRFFQDSGEPRLCIECLEKQPVFSLHRSCGHYRGMLKDFILLYKYRGCQILGKDLARFMLNSLGRVEEIWWGLDALVPVPLHPKRKRQRGFNQALLLARELAREKEIQLLKKSLVKIKNRPPQTLVQSQERGKNIKGAFGVNNEEKIKDKVVLLVDDVFTTGATITECSVTLIEAGAREVRAVTVAQA